MFAILLLLLDVNVRDFGVFICVVFKQVHVYKYRIKLQNYVYYSFTTFTCMSLTVWLTVRMRFHRV